MGSILINQLLAVIKKTTLDAQLRLLLLALFDELGGSSLLATTRLLAASPKRQAKFGHDFVTDSEKRDRREENTKLQTQKRRRIRVPPHCRSA